MPNLSASPTGGVAAMKAKLSSPAPLPPHPFGQRPSSASKQHMKTTRVRSIAAAARGSTLLLPIDQSTAASLTMSPINLPWASLLCTNPAYPSIDVTDDQILIGRKQPCALIVNHQAISGIHCRLYRKTEKADGTATAAAGAVSRTAGDSTRASLSSVDEQDEDKVDEGSDQADDEPKVIGADAVIEDKNKRKSKIKVAEMIEFLHTATPLTGASSGSSSGSAEHTEPASPHLEEAVVWKGSKNATMTQQRLDGAVTRQEIWLEDLSTNGTYLGSDSSAVKIGNGNKLLVRNGQLFTLLLPSSASHDRISYTLRVNGESPVGDSEDDAPTDTVTIVFTDIESSTNLWEASPTGMQAALEEHDRTLRTLLARFRGYEVKTEGDAFMVAFFTVLDAVKWCLAVQEAFLRLKWDEGLLALPSARKEYVDAAGQRTASGTDAQLLFNGLRVRMGLHVGQPSCRRNPTTKRMDYFGKMVNLAARVSDAGHGGQIVCTEEVCAVVQQEVLKEKERAEKEWAEERDEDEADGQDGEAEDEDDDGEEGGLKEEKESTHDFLDPSTVPHHRIQDSITPPTSTRNTGNKETFQALVQHNADTAGSTAPPPPAPSSGQRLPMGPERYARIKVGVNKKPSTLDSTLDQLTDLHSVTFIDCGVVALKGITGGTRVYQISSLSLTNRRWEPPLRAKGMADGKDMVVGDEAPLAPPCVPLTLTLYNKHSIPLQIRRNILRNRKLQQRLSRTDEDGPAAARHAPADESPPSSSSSSSSPSPPAVTVSAMKAEGKKPHRASVRFAAGDSPLPASEPGPKRPEEPPAVDSKARLHEAPALVRDSTVDLSDSAALAAGSASTALSTAAASNPAVASPMPLSADSAVASSAPAAAGAAAVTSPLGSAPRLQLTRVSGSSALAAAILHNRTAVTAQPPRAGPTPAKSATPVIAASTSPSSTLSAAAKAFTPAPSSAAANPGPVGSASTDEVRAVSSPASPGTAPSDSSSLPPPLVQQPPALSPQHRRSISSSEASSAPRGGRGRHQSSAVNRSRDADMMAEACSSAFDAEAREHRQSQQRHQQQRQQQPSSGAPIARSGPRHRGAGQYATLRASSSPSYLSYSPAVPFPALPDALYAQQAQIRAQVQAQQQAHAYAMAVLAYQQQQLQQQHYAWLQQEHQRQKLEAAAAAEAMATQQDGSSGAILSFPPAQTPPFGLSPSVSSAVPYSYSFPAGSQWDKGGLGGGGSGGGWM